MINKNKNNDIQHPVHILTVFLKLISSRRRMMIKNKIKRNEVNKVNRTYTDWCEINFSRKC